MSYTLCFDTSYYNHGNVGNQKPIDFQKAYDSGFRLWTGRITTYDGYIDSWIERDYAAASLTPLVKTVYHVLRPGYPVAQPVNVLRNGLARLPSPPKAIKLDLERGSDLGATAVTACLVNTVKAIEAWWDDDLLLYSNLNYLRNLIKDQCGLDVWLADPDQNDPLGDPVLANVVMIQDSWTTAAPGVPDTTVDTSIFLGDEAAMRLYFGADVPTPEPEEPPIPPIEEETDMDYAKIDEFLAKYPAAQVVLNVNTSLDASGNGGGTTPPPTPSNVKTVKVAEGEKANGFWQTGVKDTGKPLVSICRDDNGNPVKQWKTGTLQVFTPKATQDGPIEYYEVFGYTFPASEYPNKYSNQKCYVKLGDVEF